MENKDFLKVIDDKKEMLDALADYIWEHPELNFEEHESAAYIVKTLKEEGFSVTEGLDGMETAFTGSFGAGKPVIGMLGEFDALPNLGQVPGVCEKMPTENTNGHGCGHNLLGMGSLAAAIAVKKYLEENPGKGTVIYYGCPAEEGGSSKAFLARDGYFDCLDAAFCWHSNNTTRVHPGTNLGNCQVLFKFDGIAAHAAGNPENGRSALDAVELMNVGVNFLREHMPMTARIHYSILDAGGKAPGTIQAHAEVLYLIRSPKSDVLNDLYERVCRIAEGAALMTDTRVESTFIKAVSALSPNRTMQKVLQQSMESIPVPVPTDTDMAFYKEFAATALKEIGKYDLEHPVHYEPQPLGEEDIRFGSSDVGDASHVCPLAQIMAATEAYGTPGHSWQRTAQGKQPYAKEMARYVGKCLADAAVTLMNSPEILKEAKAELDRRNAAENYKSPLPAGVKPGALNRK